MRTAEEHEVGLEEEISDYERERGKPTPSFEHAMTHRQFILSFQQYHDVWAIPELSLDLQGFKRVPDIAVFLKRSIKGRKKGLPVTELPLLAIEILSPKQALAGLFEKADEYLLHGVEAVWIVIPEIQSITVCTKNEKQKTYTTGDVHHTSIGIIINIEQLFADIV
jgi:Uma2 family endonuclease